MNQDDKNKLNALLQDDKDKQPVVRQDDKNKQPVVCQDDKNKQPVVRQDDKNKQTAVLTDIKHQLGKEESDYSKVSQLLLNEQYKRRKTVLSDIKQASLLASLDVIAETYDIPFLQKYVDNYMELLTSIDARGRNDIVDISKYRFEEQNKLNNQLLDLARGK